MSGKSKQRVVQVYNFQTQQWSPQRLEARALLMLATITPEMAREFLTNNPNREPSRIKIEQYKRDMLANEWSMSDSCICFGVNGELYNGQNRMMALEESGTQQEFVCMFGLTKEDQSKMDCGRSRNLFDVVKLCRRDKNLSLYEASLATYLRRQTIRNMPRRATRSEEVDFLDRYLEEIRWTAAILRPANQDKKDKTRGVKVVGNDMGAAFVRAYHCFKDDAAKLQRLTDIANGLVWDDFYGKLSRKSGNAALVQLVAFIDETCGNQGQTYRDKRYHKTEKAIFNFVEGIDAGQLRSSTDELFLLDMEREADAVNAPNPANLAKAVEAEKVLETA